MDQKKILVVEDDELLRELYKEIISEEGYSVDTASDGEEGYTKMKQGGWDLVLLDIIMPKMNGLEVMTKIKTENPNYPIKVLFLTNLDKGEEIRQAHELGNGYIIKSQINPGTLLIEIKKYLDIPKSVPQ